MPKTPVQTETLRFDPYITKSISKTLLTPCRQVGLSRKRKTPTSSNDNFSVNESRITSNSSSLETPNLLDHKDSSTTEKPLVESRGPGIRIKDKKKTKVSKRLIVEDEANADISARDGEDTIKTDSLLNDGSPESKSLQQPKNIAECKASIIILDSTDLAKDVEYSEDIENVLNEKGKRNKTKSKLAKQPRDKKKTKVSRHINISDSDDEETKPLKAKQPKDKKKREVSRRVNIDSDEETKPLKELKESQQKERINLKLEENLLIIAEDEFFKEASKPKQYGGKRSKEKDNSNADSQENEILKTESKFNQQLKRPDEKADISGNVKHEDKTKTTQLPLISRQEKTKQSKKIRRSLSLKKSMSGEEIKEVNSKECFISLNPLENSHNVTESDLESLENQIQEKKKILDELKQAEIYRKKHDVKELNGSTALWKSGCISALNDLLPLLQQHGTIDMAKLLNNLRIPKDKINLTPSGDLT